MPNTAPTSRRPPRPDRWPHRSGRTPSTPLCDELAAPTQRTSSPPRACHPMAGAPVHSRAGTGNGNPTCLSARCPSNAGTSSDLLLAGARLPAPGPGGGGASPPDPSSGANRLPSSTSGATMSAARVNGQSSSSPCGSPWRGQPALAQVVHLSPWPRRVWAVRNPVAHFLAVEALASERAILAALA